MRLNLHLRGIDLIDVELHCGSRGFYLDLNVFQPGEDDTAKDTPPPLAQKADLSGTASGSYDRASGPVWEDDQPVVVRGFGFQPT